MKFVKKVWFRECETPSPTGPCLFQHFYLGHIDHEKKHLTGIHGWDGIIYLSSRDEYTCKLLTARPCINTAHIKHGKLSTESSVYNGLPFDFEMLLITALVVCPPEFPIDLGSGKFRLRFKFGYRKFTTAYFEDEGEGTSQEQHY